MPTYVSLINSTDQGIRNVKEGPHVTVVHCAP